MEKSGVLPNCILGGFCYKKTQTDEDKYIPLTGGFS